MPEELENVQDPQDELTLTEIIEQNNEAMQAIIDELETRENVSLETTTITPSTSRQTITPTKYGFSEVTVEAVDSSIDQNIEPSNIRRGVTILGVLGDCDPDKPDQTKTATPTTSQQVITADTGFELASVTIDAVTNSIDANITAGNILDGITILGVTGTAIEQASGMPSAVETLETLTSSLESEIARIFDDITQTGGILQINTTGASVTQDGTEVTIDQEGNYG